MKTPKAILPIAAFVLAGAWLIYQRQAISAGEDTNTQLQKNITAVRSSSPGAVLVPSKLATQPQTETQTEDKQANKPLDWKKIGAQCEALQANFNLDEMDLLKERFKLMSPAELLTALEQVPTHGLSAAANSLLVDTLLMPLVEKDPEAALTRHMDFLGDEAYGGGRMLTWATRKWASENPARATAWLAEQVAAGRFDSKSLDGKNELREKIESGLFSALLEADPAAAARSLGAMTEEQRAKALNEYTFEEIKEENQLAFIQLVRSQLSEENQKKSLFSEAYKMARLRGYAKIDGFLERISATSAERTLITGVVAKIKVSEISDERKITRMDIDAVREWTQTQVSGTTDQITGEVIADAFQRGGYLNFQEASELVLQYQKVSGNDDTLSAFLGNHFAPRFRESARALAAQITDPKRREEILLHLR